MELGIFFITLHSECNESNITLPAFTWKLSNLVKEMLLLGSPYSPEWLDLFLLGWVSILYSFSHFPFVVLSSLSKSFLTSWKTHKENHIGYDLPKFCHFILQFLFTLLNLSNILPHITMSVVSRELSFYFKEFASFLVEGLSSLSFMHAIYANNAILIFIYNSHASRRADHRVYDRFRSCKG